MNRKVLFVIAAVLAVILLVAIVMIFVLPNPTGAAQTPAQSTPGADAQANQPGNAGDAAAQPTAGDVVPNADPENNTDVIPPVSGDEQTSQQETENTTQTTESEEQEDVLIPNMPDVDAPDSDTLTYLEYHALSGDEQAAFINTFDSYEAFFAWYNAAEQAYKDGMIEIDNDTTIDLDNLGN